MTLVEGKTLWEKKTLDKRNGNSSAIKKKKHILNYQRHVKIP
jgi:hypothetical protein